VAGAASFQSGHHRDVLLSINNVSDGEALHGRAQPRQCYCSIPPMRRERRRACVCLPDPTGPALRSRHVRAEHVAVATMAFATKDLFSVRNIALRRRVNRVPPKLRPRVGFMAEGHLTRRVFGAILRRIWALPLPTG
jgi:hypothetical protein